MNEQDNIHVLAKWQVCRVCLISDVELYEMNYSLFQCYEQLSAKDADCQETLPRRVCRECFFRLLAAVNFRNTALRSHALLHNTFNLILRYFAVNYVEEQGVMFLQH